MSIDTEKDIEKILRLGEYRDFPAGGGLYLRIKPPKKNSNAEHGPAVWVVKRSVRRPGGKRDQISRTLGGWPEIYVIDAKVARRDIVEVFERGVDPSEIITRPKGKDALPPNGYITLSARSTFQEVAERTFKNVKRTLRSEKYQRQWWNGLSKAMDAFGNRPIRDVTPDDIGRLLYRDWSRTPESSRRLAQRLEKIFELARGAGARPVAPTHWRGTTADVL